MVRLQDVSVERLHSVIKEHRDNVSKVPNNHVPWVRPQRFRLVSNETPSDVMLVRRQDVSGVHLWDDAQERFNNISNVPNHYVSSKSQLKHPVKLRWYVSTTSLNYLPNQSSHYSFVLKSNSIFL